MYEGGGLIFRPFLYFLSYNIAAEGQCEFYIGGGKGKEAFL